MAAKAVFLDRDDTITVDPGYVDNPDAIRLAAGAAAAMKTLRGAGYKLICVTNQSGIARGKFTEQQLELIHKRLTDLLSEQGASLDAIYYCPYHPDGTVEQFTRTSEDRKPAPGMLLKAASEHDIDLSASWMVGDKPADVEAGRRAGCRTIRVLTGKFGQNELKVRADFTAANMTEAARIIMAQRPSPAKVHRPAGVNSPATDATEPQSKASSPSQQQPQAASSSPSPASLDSTEDDSQPQTVAQLAQRQARIASNNELLNDILTQLRQLGRRSQHEEFSLTKLLAGIFEGLSLLTLILGVIMFLSVSDPATQNSQFWKAMGWLAIAAATQLTALSFYVMGRRE